MQDRGHFGGLGGAALELLRQLLPLCEGLGLDLCAHGVHDHLLLSRQGAPLSCRSAFCSLFSAGAERKSHDRRQKQRKPFFHFLIPHFFVFPGYVPLSHDNAVIVRKQ